MSLLTWMLLLIPALIRAGVIIKPPPDPIQPDHGSVQAFPLAYAAAKKLNIKIIYGMEGYLVNNDKKERPYHIILLAQNLTGLQNLYYLISISYMDYFYRKPKIPRQVLIDHREGLLLGSACQAGELYQAVLQRKSPEEIQQIAAFYDYLEIQPISNNTSLDRKSVV